ncbi:hypothetical protein AK830_g2621 [Neonectria ditissima]|uniref:Uncharacterized protein n=1 Tax=Neonectria ditissima TaxID=78410 RepID=A0A0P7BJS7_9HYPO|nr:hypothetical protein AK830_g2621 [Neonectria ditissima]
MIPRTILGAFAAFSSLSGIVSAAPVVENTVLGRPEYRMEYSHPNHVWTFYVYSSGYKAKKVPVDYVEVNTATKTLIVRNVNNGFDKTKNRLRMRQILKECWTKTGLKPLDLKYVQGKTIQNFGMQSALDTCRKSMGLGDAGEFQVSPTDVAKGKKDCWARLGKTVFSGAINGAIRDFGPSKKLVQVKVTREWQGDDVLYTFQ